MRILFSCLIIAASLLSCKKKEKDADAAQTLLNVKYGTDVKQSMDVYLPAGRSTATTPVLILIHGGGWVEGSRADLNAFVDTLKRRFPQYAIINISYRLAAGGQNLFPTQEQDVKACIEYIYAKREQFRISDRFGLMGASAGAHLALLHSYKYTNPVKIKAVVSFFGPTDLTAMYNNPPNPLIPALLNTVTGATPASNAAIYQQSSPVNFVTNASAPTLLLHGSNDLVVAASQSALLQDKLNAMTVANQYVLYAGGGHGDWNATTYSNAFSQIDTFLKTHHP